MYRLFVILFFSSVFCQGQPLKYKFFIRFTDKNGSAFSISNPSAFLSQKALDRRSRQNIAVISEDLPINSSYVDSVISRGADVLTRSRWFNGVTIECDSTVLAQVVSLPFVQSTVHVYRRSAPVIRKRKFNGQPLNPNSLLKATQYSYGGSSSQISLMNAEFLHNMGYTGEGVTIAVLDDGFNTVDQHAAFQNMRDHNRVLGTWDFVSGNASVYDDDTHGMMVLSTIAGFVPGRLIGTAPDASFYLLRSEDDASENIIEEYNWEAAAEFADSAGADIISSSLGYTQFDDTLASHVNADMDGDHCPSSIAADKAVSKGMLVITSAGNSGKDPWHYIGAPSDGDSVICVGAVDSLGRHIYFSSFGPSADGDVKPNVVAQGYLCTMADPSGGVTRGNGTSFACPILAGAAACLWQKYPDLPAMRIKKAIEQSASIYYNPNDSLGYGVPDFGIASYLLSAGEIPKEDNILGIYPNPFLSLINIRFFSTKSQTVTVELMNSVGQLVASTERSVSGYVINTLTVDYGNVSNGIYFVRVSTADENFVRRVIKW